MGAGGGMQHESSLRHSIDRDGINFWGGGEFKRAHSEGVERINTIISRLNIVAQNYASFGGRQRSRQCDITWP